MVSHAVRLSWGWGGAGPVEHNGAALDGAVGEALAWCDGACGRWIAIERDGQVFLGTGDGEDQLIFSRERLQVVEVQRGRAAGGADVDAVSLAIRYDVWLDTAEVCRFKVLNFDAAL